MEATIEKIGFRTYPAYKDSGVEWLGQIPESWELSRLGKILTNKSERGRGDLDLLSITREKGVIVRDLDNEEENHNFIPDDLSNYKVLRQGQFGMNKMKAWQGSYGVSPQDGIVSPAYFVFDLEGNLNPRFFHLAIRSKLYVSFFGSASDGVRIGQWDLSKERMKMIPFLIPPLPEQKAIAEFLDKKTALIDKAIQIKERQIALLQERRQILIQQAVTRGLDPNVPLKDSGVDWIGMIPEHWEIVKIGHYSTILSGFAFPSTGFQTDGIKLLRGVNIGINLIRWNETVYWPIDKSETLKRYFLTEGDIVFGMDRPLIAGGMRIAVIEKKDLPCLLLQRVTKIRGINGLEQEYLRLILQSKDFENYFLPILSGVSVPHISPSQIQNYRFALPSENEQRSILNHIHSLTTKTNKAINIKIEEIEKLKEYKSTLINSAVTGKIKVAGV